MKCPYVIVGGLRGAEDGGACGAAEFRERVWDGWQGGWTQLLLFLQAPAEGDKHTSHIFSIERHNRSHLGVDKVLIRHYISQELLQSKSIYFM